MGTKQVIIIDEGLGMSKGKIASQASHASLNSYLKSDEEVRSQWKSEGQKKIIVEKGENSFQELIRKAERLNIPYYKVNDAGFTEVEPGTATAVGLGPERESKINKITSELKLVK